MIARQNGVFEVSGDLTMATVTDALRASQGLFADEGDWILSFAGAREVDSSAVSLLLEWRRQANARERNLSISNMPEGLQSLLKVYDLQDIFPGS
ncbi:MAG: STAS domain-containing protein [Sulfuricellaceae bacterium]|nr:STAS domain-containing protein [Sulfuricellaceae bacterium]